MLREEREVLNVINAIETIYNEVVESDDEYSKDYEKNVTALCRAFDALIEQCPKETAALLDETNSSIIEAVGLISFKSGFNTAISLILGKNEINDEGE